MWYCIEEWIIAIYWSKNGTGKKEHSCNWTNSLILNQHGNAKKEVEIWKLQLHDRTSYVMNNTLILAVKLIF